MHIIFTLILALAVVGCKGEVRKESVISDSDFRNAARNGKLELTQRYIGAGYNIDRLGMGGENALHEGILHYDIAKLLIDEGISINQQHKYDGTTPLIIGCIASNVEARTIKLLLDHGANPSTKDIHGKTALDYAETYMDEHSTDLYEYDEKAELLRGALRKPNKRQNKSMKDDILPSGSE